MHTTAVISNLQEAEF